MVSDEEGDMVSLVELDNLNGLFSKGSSIAMRPTLLSTKMKIPMPAKLTVLSPHSDQVDDEKMCCIFPGSALELKPKIDKILKEETENCLNPNSSRMLSKIPKFVQ